LSFVDPFTGSGMLCAIATGQLAARSVIEGLSPAEHLERCRKLLLPAFRWSSLMRRALAWPIVPQLAQLLPGPLLYRYSRPNPK
jgi:flavin-dependent dehydrogenase